MNMYDIIEKKKHGLELSTKEIEDFVYGYTNNVIPDYQATALLMAIYFKGMNERERFDLTMAMRDSGEILDLSAINGVKIDKHSTGGVGDKVTLVLGPVIASVGVPVAKMSGRGLGHTGGTIDKLEAFKGFNVTLSEKEFVDQVNSIGIAVVGQSANLAPADKKLYALRDLTATVDEISLITSSIMSKKLAAGTDAIVLDVTVGNGAFMKNVDDATKLAESMVKIGKGAGKKICAVMTCMEEPLGYAVGNTLEVLEAIDALKGNGPKDLMEVVYALGEQMIVFANLANNIDEARTLMEEAISSGRALDKFAEFITAQGGDASYIYDTDKFDTANIVKQVLAKTSGYVSQIRAMDIGVASMRLGGGREELDDIIDMSVGVVLNKKIGSYVEAGDVLATIYANDESKYVVAEEIIMNAIDISESIVNEPELILGVIS